MADSELERLKARRVTALYRLDLIARGTQLAYEDGTLIDMASEKDRLDSIVSELDRRIESLERTIN